MVFNSVSRQRKLTNFLLFFMTSVGKYLGITCGAKAPKFPSCLSVTGDIDNRRFAGFEPLCYVTFNCASYHN